MRLAAKLGLPKVDAVDWNENAPGDEKSYDFSAWADAHGRGDELKALIAKGQAAANAEAARKRCLPVAAWMSEINSPASLAEFAA
ncbi:hypothetical protein EC912_10552 [Luteibacter rhizovicinus]|uniref:Uncharacterized protein n=1 Tax=Luteibacter rhizovicinus TaxID=242606 RepID=A0A4R3YLX9_9GAMM|nr:hypothetical protein [Luteibacter rhizovicinus]TCV93192.1 hypothetical protein EC912_10552 [Luteibacter rhizovicinus]